MIRYIFLIYTLLLPLQMIAQFKPTHEKTLLFLDRVERHLIESYIDSLRHDIDSLQMYLDYHLRVSGIFGASRARTSDWFSTITYLNRYVREVKKMRADSAICKQGRHGAIPPLAEWRSIQYDTMLRKPELQDIGAEASLFEGTLQRLFDAQNRYNFAVFEATARVLNRTGSLSHANMEWLVEVICAVDSHMQTDFYAVNENICALKRQQQAMLQTQLFIVAVEYLNRTRSYFKIAYATRLKEKNKTPPQQPQAQ